MNVETEAMEGIASPLKPKVWILKRSYSFLILDVAWREKQSFASSRDIPQPSSSIIISFTPLSIKVIDIFLAPASIAFSTSSFTTEEGLSTTSPAAIIFDNLSSS